MPLCLGGGLLRRLRDTLKFHVSLAPSARDDPTRRGKSLRLIRNNVKPCRQKYLSSVFQKYMFTLSSSRLRWRGVSRSSRTLEAGCGGREEAQRAMRADESILADGQVVWS